MDFDIYIVYDMHERVYICVLKGGKGFYGMNTTDTDYLNFI